MLTTLLAVLVGAALAFTSSYLLGRRQRAWQDDRALLDRQLLIAEKLDEVLVDAQRFSLNREVPDGEDRWEFAHRKWEEGWVRLSPFLANPELKRRYESVGTILTEIAVYDGPARDWRKRNVLHRAIENARLGLAYFIRGEPLPSGSFPRTAELIDLLGQADPDFLSADGPLEEWLKAHPAPPWHPTPTDGRGLRILRRSV